MELLEQSSHILLIDTSLFVVGPSQLLQPLLVQSLLLLRLLELLGATIPLRRIQ